MFELVGIYSSFVMSFRLFYVNLVCQTVKLRVGHCLVAPSRVLVISSLESF